MRNRIIVGCVVSATFVWFLVAWVAMSFPTLPLRAPNGVIHALVSDSAAERLTGLSGRSHLEDEQGMVFVYSDDSLHGIWMNNMKFALDIVWINQGGEVVRVKPDTQPSTFPEVFRPSKPARYVLEIPAGKSKALGIYTGTKINLPAELTADTHVID